MTIRSELHRLIALNNAEQWVPIHIALQQLQLFGDDLISGLIQCLKDEDPDVRVLAVELLAEARPRSNSAVPFLIERLSDEDRLVRVAVINNIGDFGPLAAGAIPHVESWLEFETPYLRTLAATTIVSLDPSRTELLFDIRAALKDDDCNVRFIAREFFGKMNAKLPFDEAAFEEVVRSHWHYHSPCEQVNWRADLKGDGTWQVGIAPVFQEIWGGEDDGKRVFSGFEYHLFGLSKEAGIEIEDFGAMSRCEGDSPTPFIAIKGEYFGEPFVLRIHLEPIPGSETKELVDTVRQQVRAIELTDD